MKFLATAFLALAALAFTACGAKTEVLPATKELPTFSVAAANDAVKSYAQAANEYVSAIKAKDYTKVANLTQKVGEATTKLSSVTGLKEDEVKKLNDWISNVTKQMSDAVTAAAK